MKKYILGVVVSVLACNAVAYEGSPRKQVSQFFKDLSSEKSIQAVDDLYGSNPVMGQKVQQLTLLKQQLGTVSALFGKLTGTEEIHYEELSPSLVRVVQLAKYEHHPVTWEFYFYKPQKTWFVSQGMFVDQFQIIGKKK